MENLALAFSSGWGSGLNSYLVVLILGIADRVDDTDRIPDVLGSWPVLIVAALLYVIEFVGDKIPYVDSAWDAVSTVIRPIIGATIGVLLAGDATSLDQAVMGVVGGGSALASHTVKAGSRLAVNASPEPFTNIGLSLGEDGLVLGVVSLAVAHPHLAALIAGVLLIVGLVVVYLLARLIRRGWRRWKAKEGVEPLFKWQRTG
ncbi:DUF4126 domain-containing protein [Nocardioides nematodiphilus]|uniref:DUF4126 domain-containing protein n=1 Tax=Nocardioides nematodiphilus TaxID=2849669 RepID=UPI001CDA088E|nr:DUF4126 domain-containing protein [Nocardioides nematodiphilus]MCA1982476.1 DUF4126 domain-containing protein [Nocardioides nematodiphilus]